LRKISLPGIKAEDTISGNIGETRSGLVTLVTSAQQIARGGIMERRTFLNLAGALSAAAFVPATAFASIGSTPVEAVSGGKHYRGTQDGKILVSGNAGESWAVHADFGNGFAVGGLQPDARGVLRARLNSIDTSIDLALNARGNAWISA
jgi:hypothetical protein